jgi:oligopeptide transport system substrate-binding protein
MKRASSLALFEGLAEYDPKTSEPIPALAERWEVNKDWSEVVFYLRHDGKFSNGDPITARDFVYTIRRGLKPELGSRAASLAYPIKYAQAFNEGGVFVLDPAARMFLLEKDFAETSPECRRQRGAAGLRVKSAIQSPKYCDAETEFHRFMQAPARLVLPGTRKARNKASGSQPKTESCRRGKGICSGDGRGGRSRGVDDYTLRISLMQPAPYFISMMPHQFFRALHPKTIETFGNRWTTPTTSSPAVRSPLNHGSTTIESW